MFLNGTRMGGDKAKIIRRVSFLLYEIEDLLFSKLGFQLDSFVHANVVYPIRKRAYGIYSDSASGSVQWLGSFQMGGESNEPLKRDSRLIPSRYDRVGRLNGHPELWRELIHWLTPNQFLALGYFILSLTLSICILSTVFLEAMGLLQTSRAGDVLLIGLGCLITSGLRQATFPRRARPGS